MSRSKGKGKKVSWKMEIENKYWLIFEITRDWRKKGNNMRKQRERERTEREPSRKHIAGCSGGPGRG